VELWIENGAQLGWLIDADARTVYVYRRDRLPETQRDNTVLVGEGAVKGLVLRLAPIWRGLS